MVQTARMSRISARNFSYRRVSHIGSRCKSERHSKQQVDQSLDSELVNQISQQLITLSKQQLLQPESAQIIATHQHQALPELREAIVEKTKRDSHYEITVDQVLVTNGGKQAVYQAFATIIDPGDEVILPSPFLDNISRSNQA